MVQNGPKLSISQKWSKMVILIINSMGWLIYQVQPGSCYYAKTKRMQTSNSEHSSGFLKASLTVLNSDFGGVIQQSCTNSGKSEGLYGKKIPEGPPAGKGTAYIVRLWTF